MVGAAAGTAAAVHTPQLSSGCAPTAIRSHRIRRDGLKTNGAAKRGAHKRGRETLMWKLVGSDRERESAAALAGEI